jgi:CheY-like chemotaxis protein
MRRRRGRTVIIKELAMNSGANFLITKPFSPETMQEALSPILGKG